MLGAQKILRRCCASKVACDDCCGMATTAAVPRP